MVPFLLVKHFTLMAFAVVLLSFIADAGAYSYSRTPARAIPAQKQFMPLPARAPAVTAQPVQSTPIPRETGVSPFYQLKPSPSYSRDSQNIYSLFTCKKSCPTIVNDEGPHKAALKFASGQEITLKAGEQARGSQSLELAFKLDSAMSNTLIIGKLNTDPTKKPTLLSLFALKGQLIYYDGTSQTYHPLDKTNEDWNHVILSYSFDPIKLDIYLNGKSVLSTKINCSQSEFYATPYSILGGSLMIGSITLWKAALNTAQASSLFDKAHGCHSFKEICQSSNLCQPRYCKADSLGLMTCEVNPSKLIYCPSVSDTDCVKNICDPNKGICEATTMPNGAACDDQSTTTINDHCAAGKCEGVLDPKVECLTNMDCLAKEDGNYCNGTLFCDLSIPKPACKLNPSTVKQCPDKLGNSQCMKGQCIPETGKCGEVNQPDGFPCDDNNAATIADKCVAGSCKSEWNSAVQCTSESDCGKYEDGNLCNGILYCKKFFTGNVLTSSKCILNPATPISCPTADDTDCTKNTCNPASGVCEKTKVSDGLICNAQSPIDSVDKCVNGSCIAGKVDGIQCLTHSDCLAYEDNNQCNGTQMICETKLNDKAKITEGKCVVNKATLVTCPTAENTACQTSQCNSTSGKCGLININEGGPCEGDNNLSTSDVCVSGQCISGKLLGQCQSNTDCSAFEDDNPCNGKLICKLYYNQDGTQIIDSKCEVNPVTIVQCQTGLDTECKKTVCNPKTGACEKTNIPNGFQCSPTPYPKPPYGACTNGECK